MKIGSTVYFKPNFKGDYWLTTDVHDKLPMHCGVLDKMSESIKSSKEKTTLLDNGDSFGNIFRLGATQKILENFTRINPDTNVVFNMGNKEIYTLTREITKEELKGGYANLTPAQQDKIDYIKMMQELKAKNNKIHFISCFSSHLEARCDIPKGLIEPYAIIDDVVDGENKKVLILGTTIGNGREFGIETQKAELKKVIDEIKEKGEEYDYAVLMSHNNSDKGKDKSFSEIIDFIEENGIKNLKFVVGGHMHALYDDNYKGKKILFPPASGKGALMVALRKNEVYAPKLNIGADAHDSTCLNGSNDKKIIANTNISNPIKISKAHEEILLEANKDYKKQLIQMPLSLKAKDYSETLTNTSEVGTFFANSARDITGADFAFFLFSDFREAPPEKGSYLTPYSIKDTINFDKSIWMRTLSINEVKELFEIAFRDQKNPENPCGLEFSDNIRITRSKNGEEVIKQIEFKKDGKWLKLLDENAQVKNEFKNTTFKIATCSQLAQGKRFGFEMFKDDKAEVFIDKSREIYNPKFILEELDPEFQGRILESTALIWGLNQAKEKGIEKIKRAEVLTV